MVDTGGRLEGRMSRGDPGRNAPVDLLAWIASVKVGAKREMSSGTGSSYGAEHSRMESDLPEESARDSAAGRRAGDKVTEEHSEEEGSQSLQDEYVCTLKYPFYF